MFGQKGLELHNVSKMHQRPELAAVKSSGLVPNKGFTHTRGIFAVPEHISKSAVWVS